MRSPRRPTRLPAALAAAAALSCAAPAPVVPPPPPRPRPDLLLEEARAARAGGDDARAEDLLGRAIAADPAWPAPRVDLAELLVAEGRDLDAARAALAGVPLDAPDPRAALARAQVLELSHDAAAAADAYARALALRDDPDVRLRRAALLAQLGRDGEATAELLRVRGERPADPAARLALADLHERAGRLADAERELRAAAEGAPERAAGWERLAGFYARTGQGAKARDAEARARAARPAPGGRTLRPLLPSAR